MGRKRRGISKMNQDAKLSQPPGTLIYVGDAPECPSELALMPIGMPDNPVLNPDDEQLKGLINGQTQYWLQVQGIHDVQSVARLGDIFGLHPLVLEDVLDTSHRPKAEDYGKYLFITLKLPRVAPDSRERWLEQVSLVLGGNFLITFQDSPSEALDNIKKCMRSPKWQKREHAAGYLLYAIVDTIIDNYYSYYEALQDDYEDLEMQVLQTPSQDSLQSIMAMKHETLGVRKALWPMRDIISQMERHEGRLMPKDINIYLRDISDHVLQLTETAEIIRDLMSVSMDIYLSSTNNRINEVMKVLTIFASLFMPLTFLTSLYGMNFDFMPELHLWWAYPLLLLIMLCLVAGMLVFFRRRKWI